MTHGARGPSENAGRLCKIEETDYVIVEFPSRSGGVHVTVEFAAEAPRV